MSSNTAELDPIGLAAEIVSAYVSRNSVPTAELPGLIQSVHAALSKLGTVAEPEPARPQPAVPIKKSVQPDFIVCLEDGKHFKSLKRHLHSEHGMLPAEYRAKWGLTEEYPMVAPAYAKSRSDLAISLGLGRRAAAPSMQMPDPEVASAPAKARRGRKAKTAA